MSSPEKSKFSVLIMGKTQAGKSTLVEHIKNYADPRYSIDMSFLGNGNVSKTEFTRPFYVESNLPAYEVFHKESGVVIDLDNLASKTNEEDFRDILFAREKNVGLRLAPHDPNGPSDIVEFRFLDTPGLNDTNDRDSSHAVNIISEMINTRSFNLIVIIVSYKNPLTQEQQLALEYYANVFKGLHSRIMFLHTHVDYANIHHTNDIYHLNMKMKNKVLSKIFRQHDTDVVFDEENIKEYPSMTIDLVSKKRPVINCLIRNTIREILKMATGPPAILNTSSQNIERIRTITHPTKFNDEERKRTKARFAAEAAKLPKQAEEEQVDVGGEDLEQINILLIGDVQSGKTSLVETFKLYADVDYQVKTEHITQGNSRFADEKVKITAFLADLHTVQIHKRRGNTSDYDVIDLEEVAKTLNEEAFTEIINLDHKGADTVIIASNSAKKYRFNIYEGPSLNESADNFEKNIFSVHRTLVESMAYFHQVLFTLAPGPITSAIRTTIRVCSDIFSDLSSLFSFVHTKIDYPELHIGNKQFQESMKEKTELLRRYIQSSATPFMIDCNLQTNLPVQRAKTYNVVHEILKSAISQTPVALKSPLMKKTPKMVAIDTNLMWQARDAFQDTQKEITQNKKDLLDLRRKIRQLGLDYKTKDQEVNSAKNKEDVTTRDDVEVIFEEKFTAAYEPYPEIYSKIMTFKKQPRTVEKVHMVAENVEIEQAIGGEGFNHWKIIYRRTSGAAASLMVKLYAKKQDSTGNPVGETVELAKIRRERLDLEKQLAAVEERIRSKWHLQQEYNLLRDWISRETLPKAVMEELTRAEVYEAKETPFDKIKEIYLKSGGVYDTDPLESVKTPAEAFNVVEIDEDEDFPWDCKICGERGCDRAACKAEEVERGDVRKELEQINILLIGDAQSGKTSLVETFRLYGDTHYIVNTQHITKDNNCSANETLKITSFLAELHTVQIRKLKVSTGGYDVVDLEEEAKALNEEDFEDLLNLGPKNAETVIIGSNGAKKYRFNIYEGPSLNESDENYEKYIFSIHQSIVESESQFHQVLFTLAPGPITSARSIIRTFCDIFSDINSLFSFVHTKIDYPKLHVSNMQFQHSMNERQEMLQQYTQSTATPYLIDNNLTSNRPVQRGKTMNVVHDILLAAISHPAVELGRSLSASHKRTVVYDTDSKLQPEDTVKITNGGLLQHASFFSGEAPDIPVTVTSAYTILVLGRSQSGKSTLVEHIKSYADSVEVTSNLRAMRTPHTVFQSNLPTYEAIQKDNGTILNVTHLADIFSEDYSGFLEYHELLRSSERNFVARVSPPMTSLPQPKTLAYMILDTPGINNSVNDDETITKLMSSHPFNLVLIVISFWYPLTIELQLALEYYSKVLQGLHCNVAFLHTRVDYADHHPHNEDFYRNLKLRNLLLSRIFQDPLNPGSTTEGKARSHMVPKVDEMEEHPSFTLDLRSDKGPIIHCLNCNTIRDILCLAASNSPQRIDTSDENMNRIRAIPHPKNFTDSQRRKIQESIAAEDEKQKLLSVADDCIGRSYSLKDTSFHKTRSIYKELVDPATSSGRSFRHTRSPSTSHGKS
ncbi:hypothetical protein BG005_003914 [Podila minutissima]|nr:hypothetical protein BG005_003914 [Podila minutissima]